MTILYIIYTTNPDKKFSGFVGDTTNVSGQNFTVKFIPEDKLMEGTKEVVICFSKQKAKKIRDEIVQRVLVEHPTTKVQFTVVAKDFPQEVVDEALQKKYVFQHEIKE